KLTTINGERKLSDYIDLEETNSLTEIHRADGERYISINADIEGQDISTVTNEINKIIENTSLDQGYSVEVTGDMEEQQQAVQDLVIIFMISLFLVFVVMAIQFNSLKHTDYFIYYSTNYYRSSRWIIYYTKRIEYYVWNRCGYVSWNCSK